MNRSLALPRSCAAVSSHRTGEKRWLSNQPIAVAIYPPANIPTVYADAVANLAHSPQVVKFYLTRFDPSLDGVSPAKSQTFTQIAMAMPGFLDAVAFFQWQIEVLVNRGVISREQVAEATQRYAENPRT